jgi:hypothetical protein
VELDLTIRAHALERLLARRRVQWRACRGFLPARDVPEAERYREDLRDNVNELEMVLRVSDSVRARLARKASAATGT